MKITLEKILNDLDNLKALGELKLPIKVSYRVKRLLDKLNPFLKSYNEERNSLILQLGEEDPKTKQTTVKKENEKEFFDKIKALQEVEEEIDFETIKIAELGNITVEPKLLVDWVFTE